jgi:hypothetical protein
MLRAAALFVCVLISSTASAQDRRPYLEAGSLVSTQGSHRPGESPSFPRSGVGGTALGIAAAAGGFLASAVSIAFEASLPARFESVQETDYFQVFRTANRHRDIILSGLFHFHMPASDRVDIALAAGPSVVREDTLQRTAFQTGPASGVLTGTFGPFGPDSSLTRWTVAITGGADVALRVSRHVSVVPQFRIHRIERAEQGEGDSGFLGLGSWVMRPAVGVRANF